LKGACTGDDDVSELHPFAPFLRAVFGGRPRWKLAGGNIPLGLFALGTLGGAAITWKDLSSITPEEFFPLFVA
jgi:hypothetical protein